MTKHDFSIFTLLISKGNSMKLGYPRAFWCPQIISLPLPVNSFAYFPYFLCFHELIMDYVFLMLGILTNNKCIFLPRSSFCLFLRHILSLLFFLCFCFRYFPSPDLDISLYYNVTDVTISGIDGSQCSCIDQ